MSEDHDDYVKDLDRQIAEVRAQIEKLHAMAASGDKVAQIVVRRLNEAQQKVFDIYAKNHFFK